MSAQTVVVVGGGPRAVGLVERICANHALVAPGHPLRVDVVDPYPVGGGRIWRRDQSRLLWMNSVAEDITIFTDDSVDCAGPVVPGPSLSQWGAGPGRSRLAAAGWVAAGQSLDPKGFSPRGVQAEYLDWVWQRVLDDLPSDVEVTTHADRAVGLVDDGDQQVVTLASGERLVGDVVLLAQGYLECRPTAQQQGWVEEARSRGLTYLPPGHTADMDLSGLRPGEDVVVRGMGLAFVDLVVLLGEGRGGTFSGEGSDLVYHPSGKEPVLHVGSRRGVPYHSKLGYDIAGSRPVPPRYLTLERLDRVGGSTGLLDFRRQLWPLVALELSAAHYRRLFAAHPERTRGTWEELEAVLTSADLLDPAVDDVVAAHVPDPRDRFTVPLVDRPLLGRHWARRDDLEEALVAHVASDLAQRADPAHSPDRAVFDALLGVYAVLSAVVAGGRVTPQDRVRFVEGAFHGFFSFLASGPPPRRLAELLALHRAGVVRFVGPDMTLDLEGDTFVVRSPSVPGEVRARAAVDARLPRTDVRAVTDPLVADLLERGELSAQDVVDHDGTRLGGGQLLADRDCRAVRPDGTVHPTRFLLGPSVSGSAGAAGFSRPGFNGPGFRQNDHVAREVLHLVARTAAAPIRKDVHRHAS